jgi:hypothetical protein
VQYRVVTTEKLASSNTSQYEDSFQFEVVNAVTVNISCGRSTQTRQRIGIRNPEKYGDQPVKILSVITVRLRL